ncbi:MAG: CRTAC1 family protein [Gemmatimonadota bacterium]|nr:CRTAC1 family protein [Gemmatimonadota bacterium]
MSSASRGGTTARIVAGVLFVGAISAVAVLGRPAGAGEEVSDLGFRLSETAAERGIDFRHQSTTLDPRLDNVAPHVAGIGASVAVTDYDGDGWSDLYFTSSRFGTPNGLYRNRGDGSFESAGAGAGLADLNEEGVGASMGSVWGDYDNDGREDVFVYGWGYQRLFRNVDGTRFEDVSAASGLRVWMNSNAAIWLDYDADGHLDLYLAGYFRSDIDMWNLESTRIMQNSFEFATNGGRNRLFRSRGDGTFEDVTEAAGVGSTRWTLAVASADFDEDGLPDLYLANDYGPEELYLNRGDGTFELADGIGLSDDSKSGMSVALGDVHNRGRLDVFVTNISERGYLFQGNNLRINHLVEANEFQNVARGVLADAGWAWGAQFGDLDNDGFQDLYIVNGFISADRERDYWYGMSKVAGAQGAIFEDARTWPPIGDASLSGYERSRLLLRRGEFVDVAESAGVSDDLDGRAVAFADLENRGVLDVIVANQNGPPLLYRNEIAPVRRWIQIELEGRVSNRSAIGAEVIVEFGGARQRQVVAGGLGFASQNQRRLHFGLGDVDRVERAVVRWPSGIEQELGDLEVDRLHRVVEPETP